jgi:hypothetical protein
MCNGCVSGPYWLGSPTQAKRTCTAAVALSPQASERTADAWSAVSFSAMPRRPNLLVAKRLT